MRINQYLAGSTTLSRRGADEAIERGEVTVNGRPAAIGQFVSPDADVRYRGRAVIAQSQEITIALNKPVGVVCSRRRQGTSRTIYDLLPPELARLNPAGRLDKDSSGLVVMTSDGNLLQRLSHPSNDKRKLYDLVLDRSIGVSDLGRLRDGVELEDGPSRLEIVKCVGKRLAVALTQGRNRQIRRTLAAIGYEVRDLHRTQVAQIKLGDLAVGSWRTIEPQELS